MMTIRSRTRPHGAVEPGPGQESAWDYPRPPRMEPVPDRVRVVVDGVALADTTRAVRILETSHPPVYYIPEPDVRLDLLVASPRTSVCEFKGRATYVDLALPQGTGSSGLGRLVASVGWRYPAPNPGFEGLRGHLAFYADRVDEAWVGDERVIPQDGDFYGGWITSRVVGPFKGGPGTLGW
jgi:uncharacterized protein (DUF427 family)